MLVMGKVRLLRDVLRARQLGAVRVGTVDDYQGQEAKIIIISTVISASSAERHSSSRLGFMSDPKRFNVAISRAKASHASVTMSIAEITDVRLMSSCSPMLLCRRYSLSLATHSPLLTSRCGAIFSTTACSTSHIAAARFQVCVYPASPPSRRNHI